MALSGCLDLILALHALLDWSDVVPVTRGITEFNMHATQLQVAMGIPLYKIPQIRRLYKKGAYLW